MSKATPNGQEATDAPTITDREHFEFSVPASGIVAVANTRHDETTTYAVNVSQNSETTACSCPADEYQPGRCKHRHGVEATPAVMLAAAATGDKLSEDRA
jgi:uncharacterized Zn finger protein